MKLLLVFVFTIVLAAHEVSCSKSHPVTTLLNAKWHVTPVCLEIAEYLADESPTYFWDYVRELNSLPTPLYQIDTDATTYKTSLAVAEKLIGGNKLSLLKLSLSMHSLSPRVQAHFQIAHEVVRHGDCQTTSFVTIGNRVACNINELKKGLKKALKEDTPKSATSTDDGETAADDEEEVYSFDHIYPGSENNTLTTVLYGELGSKDYAELHTYLAKKAEKGRVKFISRHYIRVSIASAGSILCPSIIVHFIYRIPVRHPYDCLATALNCISNPRNTRVKMIRRRQKVRNQPNSMMTSWKWRVSISKS